MAQQSKAQGDAETERLLLVRWTEDYSGDFARIISATAAGHRASRRVMEKCGLTFQAETTFRGAPIAWYAVDRPGS